MMLLTLLLFAFVRAECSKFDFEHDLLRIPLQRKQVSHEYTRNRLHAKYAEIVQYTSLATAELSFTTTTTTTTTPPTTTTTTTAPPWTTTTTTMGPIANILLYDDFDYLYFGAISLSTPEQIFYMDFDTGSANLWIPDSSCISCPSCYARFYSNESYTFQWINGTFNITYGDGSYMLCDLGSDILNIDSLIANITFGLAYDINDTCAGYDGLFGLGFKSLAEDYITPPIVDLYKQGAIANKMFAFYLNSSEFSNNTDSSSELTIGGYDESKFSGNITWLPLSHDEFYQVDLRGVKVGDKLIQTNAESAIIDSGTSWLVATYEDFVSIGKELNNTTPILPGNNTWYVLCDDIPYLPNISFTLGSSRMSQTFEVSGYDYVRENGPGSINCTIEIDCCDDMWILGDVFMRRWYSIFDMGGSQMGFARAI